MKLPPRTRTSRTVLWEDSFVFEGCRPKLNLHQPRPRRPVSKEFDPHKFRVKDGSENPTIQTTNAVEHHAPWLPIGEGYEAAKHPQCSTDDCQGMHTTNTWRLHMASPQPLPQANDKMKRRSEQPTLLKGYCHRCHSH